MAKDGVPALRVIEGGTPLNKRRRRAPSQWLCRTCEKDIGVATSALVQVWVGAMMERGRLKGGIKIWVCQGCQQRGKHTPAT